MSPSESESLQLPFDVIAEILAYCDKSTLASCASVNHQVLQAARLHLYHSLDFSTYDLLATKNLLFTSSHLLYLTRRLTVILDQNTTHLILSAVSRHKVLTSLHLVVLLGWRRGIENFLDPFRRIVQMESLKRLRTRTPPSISPSVSSDVLHEFMDIIISFKETLDLEVSQMLVAELNKIPVQHPLPQLDTLRYHVPNSGSDALNQWLVLQSHFDWIRLRRFSLQLKLCLSALEGWSSILISVPDTIEELSVKFSPDQNFRYSVLGINPFGHFTSLRWLSIFLKLSPLQSVSISPSISFLDSLLQNISSLSKSTLYQINIFLEWEGDPNDPDAGYRNDWEILARTVSSFPSRPKFLLHVQVADSTTDVPAFGNMLLSIFPKAKVTIEREIMFEGCLGRGNTMEDSWPFFSLS